MATTAAGGGESRAPSGWAQQVLFVERLSMANTYIFIFSSNLKNKSFQVGLRLYTYALTLPSRFARPPFHAGREKNSSETLKTFTRIFVVLGVGIQTYVAFGRRLIWCWLGWTGCWVGFVTLAQRGWDRPIP